MSDSVTGTPQPIANPSVRDEYCDIASPVGSSVSESLVQMAKLSKTVQEAPVIEWDEDVLDIVEPYFLFFLRCSPHLSELAKSKE